MAVIDSKDDLQTLHRELPGKLTGKLKLLSIHDVVKVKCRVNISMGDHRQGTKSTSGYRNCQKVLHRTDELGDHPTEGH